MSEQAVLDAAQTLGGTISGITVTRQGWPQAVPWTGGIGLVLYLDAGSRRQQRLSNGPGGTIAFTYLLCWRLILGDPSLPPAAALAAGAPFDDRLRAAIYADPQMSGTCWDSLLLQGVDNFTTFTRDQVHPALLWRQAITEHRAANAAAA